MVENPLETLATFQIPPGSIITFHTETKNNKKHIVDYILAKNWQPSIAISPKTPINEIFPWVQHVYQVLVMSVEPGAAGQSFLKDTIRKLDPLIGYRATTQLPFRIAIDGGIDPISLRLLADEEIDDFAIGSAIFNSPNPVEALKILDGIVNI
jgi:ribulose-phosphate 3-epimerase